MSCKQPGVYRWYHTLPSCHKVCDSLSWKLLYFNRLPNHLTMTAMHHLMLASAVLIAASQAFNITSPVAGSVVDTTSDWNIEWTNDSPHVNYTEMSFTLASPEDSQYLINASTTAGQVVVPGGRVVIPSSGNCTIHVNTPGDERNAYITSSPDFTMQSTQASRTTTAGGAAATSTSAANARGDLHREAWTFAGLLTGFVGSCSMKDSMEMKQAHIDQRKQTITLTVRSTFSASVESGERGV